MPDDQLCPTEKQRQFRLINTDITGICNLRCRFCFNDFAKADRALMSMEQFEALTSLMGQVPDKRFFVSCLYEPTLHPRFAEILSIIPELGRKKAFFTTNMARVLDDATLLAISRSRVAHVNISIETLRPNIYQYLCGSRRFKLFYKNLQTLARLRRGSQDITPLRFITMVLRANYQELLPIVKVCKENLGADEHELRTPYYDDYPQKKFVEEQLLFKIELEKLLSQLQSVDQQISCDFSIWHENLDQMRQAGENKTDDMIGDRLVPPRYFDIRVNASGLAEFNCGTQKVQLTPETTASVFAEQMRVLCKGLPSFFRTDLAINCSNMPVGHGLADLEQCSCFADTLTFSGWYLTPVTQKPTHLHFETSNVLVEHFPRPDVAARHQVRPGWICKGFRAVLPYTSGLVPVPILIHAENDRPTCKWQFEPGSVMAEGKS